MKRLALFIILLTACAAAAEAQYRIDVITLKNGAELKGEIIARDSSYVIFKTADGTLTKQIQTSEITSESRQELSASQYREIGGDIPKVFTPSSREKGYGAYVDILAGTSTIYPGWFDLTTSHGYFITPQVFVGGGAGLSLKLAYTGYGYDGAIRRTSMSVPVFATARYYFINNRKCSPYIDGKAGYAIPVYDAIDATEAYNTSINGVFQYRAIRSKGFYFNISVGVEINRFTLSLGLTGTNSQDIEFNEDLYIDYPDMTSSRWTGYSNFYRYMDAAWFINFGYRF